MGDDDLQPTETVDKVDGPDAPRAPESAPGDHRPDADLAAPAVSSGEEEERSGCLAVALALAFLVELLPILLGWGTGIVRGPRPAAARVAVAVVLFAPWYLLRAGSYLLPFFLRHRSHLMLAVTLGLLAGRLVAWWKLDPYVWHSIGARLGWFGGFAITGFLALVLVGIATTVQYLHMQRREQTVEILPLTLRAGYVFAVFLLVSVAPLIAWAPLSSMKVL